VEAAMKSDMSVQVFDFFRLKGQLPHSVFERFRRTVDEKSVLDREAAELVAQEIYSLLEA